MSNADDEGRDEGTPVSQIAGTLLALGSIEEQVSLVQTCFDDPASGLDELLDEATGMVRGDPAQARRLATVCATVATQLGLMQIVPRADYLRAQTYALAGEFDPALELIKRARDGYDALGERTAVMRTTAGLMSVLGELGRYQEALDAGQRVLDEIGPDVTPDSPLAPLAALMHQNRGMCFSLSGRHEQALAAYDASESIWLGLGMTDQAGDISNNRGVLLWELGRGTEALAAFENALDNRVIGDQTLLYAQSLNNVGSAHLLLGNYTTSLELFGRALDLFESLGESIDRYVVLLDTATAYMTLNLHTEASDAFREAESFFRTNRVVHYRVRALWGLGAAYLAMGRLDEAQQALSDAIAALEQMDAAPPPLMATLLLEQSAALAAQQQVSQAIATAGQALAIIGDDWPIQAVYANLQLADLVRNDPAQAERYLSAAERAARPIDLPHFRYRLRWRLGRLRQQQGRPDEAQAELEAALAEIEALRGNLIQDQLRTAFLDDKSAAYQDLLRLHLEQGTTGGPQRAFDVAERGRSRSLLDLVSDTGARGAVGRAPVGETDEARLWLLQADLNAVYNQLLSPGVEGAGSVASSEFRPDVLQERASQIERAIGQLQLRARPQGATNLWASPLSLTEIQAQLADDVSVIVYQVLDGEIMAFVVNRNAFDLVRNLGRASDVRPLIRRLGGLMDRLRAGEALNDKMIATLEVSVRRVLGLLHEALFAPLMPLLQATATAADENDLLRLAIVPHSFLHQVPFNALHDGERYLIDTCEISYAPSATLHILCQQRPLDVDRNPVLVGVPDAAIPAVAQEVAGISRLLPYARVLLGEGARWDALRDEAAGASLLHLACHGQFRADSPMFSSLKLHDRWLTAYDAIQIDLSDALVTLSACESGRSHITGGDEILGLLRAFLGAGAATAIVSLWLAHDEVVAKLMYNMYSELLVRKSNPAAALRAAQLALKTEHSHPYFWAPFIAVGHR